jgi:lysyl-tRNA synthetase class 2
MSAQGVVDAVKDGVQQVADKLQSATVQDSNSTPTTTTDEAKPNETKPQTLLDEVTGEYVSKSELKKRQKQRQKDIAKAEKESTRQAPPAPKKKNAADDEAQLNPNVSGWNIT